jgi:hypothetical protein
VKLEGTVVSVAAGEIVISGHLPAGKDGKETPEDTNWTVETPQTTIRVSGDAKPDYLKAGQTVQFTATIEEGEATEKTVEIKDKIQELTIVTPPAHAARGTTPAHKTPKKSDSEGAASTPAGPQAVVGRLAAIHEHKWPVRFGNKTLQIQLADDVKIHVDMTGPSVRRLISPGDKISVEGQMIRNKPGRCQASDIHVTLSHPLTGAKGKRPGGRKPREPKSD